MKTIKINIGNLLKIWIPEKNIWSANYSHLSASGHKDEMKDMTEGASSSTEVEEQVPEFTVPPRQFAVRERQSPLHLKNT